MIPGVGGVYAVFCFARAALNSNGSIVLMQDDNMYSSVTLNIANNFLTQSLMAIVELEANKPVYMQVMGGPITMAVGTNASISMFLIKNSN